MDHHTSSGLHSLDIDEISVSTIAINDVSITATGTEINILAGTTVTSPDLTKLHDITATASEINILDGATVTSPDLT